MPVVSKLATALPRKRLAGVLIVVTTCALIGACGNDDRPTGATTANSSASDSPADKDTGTVQVPAQDNPLAASHAPAAVTIQSPALPVSGADAALSAAASTPLATPIIHTAD